MRDGAPGSNRDTTIGQRLAAYLQTIDASDPVEAFRIAIRDIASTARHLDMSEPQATDFLAKLDASLFTKLVFESRLLDQYSHFVKASELRESEAFFRISFLDSDMLIPVIDTLIYIGKDEHEDGLTYAVFEDAAIRLNAEGSDTARIRYSYPIDSLNGLYTFERALETLMVCSIARKGPHQRSARMMTLADGRRIPIKNFSFIGDDVYAVNYFTELGSLERESLVNEVESIWDVFRNEVERHGFSTAKIVAHRHQASAELLPEPPIEFSYTRKSGEWVRE